jgi:anti-sigma factor RsiW
MMLDDAGFDRNDKITGREPVQRKDKPTEQLYDREVPLNGGATHSLLHDWLDGEVDVMRASEVEGKSKVELWTRINAESEMLRRRVTPVGVQQRIMASLPDTPGTASSWWKHQLTITPVAAIAIGVALLAIGALIIQALR